jgi:phosphopantothenoylcysteine synthetase/decarboxylase
VQPLINLKFTNKIPLGCSHYYIRYESVEAFNELLDEHMSERDALNCLCSAKEFEEVKVGWEPGDDDDDDDDEDDDDDDGDEEEEEEEEEEDGDDDNDGQVRPEEMEEVQKLSKSGCKLPVESNLEESSGKVASTEATSR